jgi:hypothetical protein
MKEGLGGQVERIEDSETKNSRDSSETPAAEAERWFGSDRRIPAQDRTVMNAILLQGTEPNF